jgi:hypothetical protein
MARSEELNLQPGELVEVRSPTEILGTLDESATLDGLPFMPEMLAFCNQRVRVFRRAHKACDTICWSGLRGMDRTVHLEGLRCDGSVHDGCQAGCLLFWKEAWLRRVAADALPNEPSDEPNRTLPPDRVEWLRQSTRAQSSTEHSNGSSEPRFRCQATELRNATYPLSPLNPRQYACDVRSNGATWGGVARGLFRSAANRLRTLCNCSTLPRVTGTLKRTPIGDLGFEPGEHVEVKSHAEILATLDAKGKNRGLTFDVEMVPYCGRRFRVLRRVERIIEEATGKSITIPGRCVILDGVVCQGIYHRSCPRSTYPYWREIWLRRVDDAEA